MTTPDAATPVAAPVAPDATTIANIAERLSFFFSNANIRSDKFMQKHLDNGGDAFAGALEVDSLLKFKSIQQYSEEATTVMEAAKTLGDLLVVDDEKKTISRKTPMTKSQMDDNIPLSLHVSNLPVVDDKYTVTATELRPLFEVYGKVALVKMKWIPDFNSGGAPGDKRRKMIPAATCLVEFETADAVTKATADLVAVTVAGEGEVPATTTPAPKTLEIKGSTLLVEGLADWIAARKAGKKEKTTTDKKRKVDDAPPAPPIEVKEFTFDWKPGCVVQLKGLNKDACDREAIRAVVDNEIPGLAEGAVYADYSRGQADGAVRFSEPSEAITKLAAQINAGEVEVAGAKVESACVLEGDAEKAYWDNFIEFKNKQIRHKAEEKATKRQRRR